MKLIIAGSRKRFVEFNAIDKALVELREKFNLPEPTELVSGGAQGVDKRGEQWALYRTDIQKNSVFKPDYNKYPGKVAPLMRNVKMSEYADALIAFPDSRTHSGTRHMIEQMKGRNKPYLVIEETEAT